MRAGSGKKSRKVCIRIWCILSLFAVLLSARTLKANAATGGGINYTRLTLTAGSSRTLKVSGVPKVSWSSSNPGVAGVSAKGRVTARKKGSAAITAKARNKKYKCQVR